MDGAYRISQGYLPYKDFGLPLGPISFYFPSLFISIFGNNFLSIQLSQLVLNIFLLIIVNQILREVKANKIEMYSGIFFSFSIFYLILINNPWYNVTATFFYFLSILFILKNQIINTFYLD